MRTLRPILAGSVLASLAAVACGGARDDGSGGESSALAEASTPRLGSTINSPSVTANKMYWGSRSIDILQRVGYLTDAEAQLAKRADGIIDNSPPNGRIGVDELAALESPQHIATLFPQEKATIPKLWKILEMGSGTAAAAPSLTIVKNVVDAYNVAPFELPISQLPVAYQTLAQRVQLTENADSNAQTISGTDVAKAYKNKGSYLPTEVQQFANIALAIADAAPKFQPDQQYVAVTSPVPGTTTLGTAAGANIVADTQVGPSGAYAMSTGATSLPTLLASTAVRITLPTNVFAVVLDPTTGYDQISTTSTMALSSPKNRVEIWSAGARVGDFEESSTPAVTDTLPFGYSIKVGTSTYRIQPGNTTYSYVTVQAGSVPPVQIVPPTSYGIFGSPTGARLDLFPTGRALIVENGKSSPCFPRSADYQGRLVSCYTVNANGSALANYNLGQHPMPDSPDQGYQAVSGANLPLFAY